MRLFRLSIVVLSMLTLAACARQVPRYAAVQGPVVASELDMRMYGAPQPATYAQRRVVQVVPVAATFADGPYTLDSGDNNTNRPRRSVTPMFCKPFMKQQFDYPRAVGYDMAEKLLPHTRQVLGYNARVPASLDEWYQPRERRMYRPDQG